MPLASNTGLQEDRSRAHLIPIKVSSKPKTYDNFKKNQSVSNVVTSKFNLKITPISKEINESYTTLKEDIGKKSNLLFNDKTVKFDVQGQAKSIIRIPLDHKKT